MLQDGGGRPPAQFYMAGRNSTPPAAGHGVLQDGDGRPPAQFYMAERNSNDLLQVMEYCNMGSLGDAVSQGLFHNRKAPRPENLDLLAVLRSGAEIASALCYLHDGEITHGDLSGGLAGADWTARGAPEVLCTCQCRLKSHAVWSFYPCAGGGMALLSSRRAALSGQSCHGKGPFAPPSLTRPLRCQSSGPWQQDSANACVAGGNVLLCSSNKDSRGFTCKVGVVL